MHYHSEETIAIHRLEKQSFNQELETLFIERLNSNHVSMTEVDWKKIYKEIENRLQETIPEHEKAILTQAYSQTYKEGLQSRVVSVTRKPTFVQDVTVHAMHLGETNLTKMNKFLLAIQKSLESNFIKSQVIYRFE